MQTKIESGTPVTAGIGDFIDIDAEVVLNEDAPAGTIIRTHATVKPISACQLVIERQQSEVKLPGDGAHAPFIERLKHEHRALAARLAKLEKFVDSAGFNALNPVDSGLLLTQLHIMRSLDIVLTQRLVRLGVVS